MRIGVGGFLHETNTFAPTKASYDDFERGAGWPAMARGSDVVAATRGVNIAMSGFVAAAEAQGWELMPTLWCAASPSAHVRKEAYERVVAEIVDGLASAGPLDGIYLDLHGAMVAEHVDDGEGELLTRLRHAVGGDIPVVASLDLHANVTSLMMARADALIAYRTYPHIDMADTGRASRPAYGAAARIGSALRQGVSAIAFLDPGELAMHERRAVQAHLR